MKSLISCLLFLSFTVTALTQSHTLKSPNGKIQLSIEIGKKIIFSVIHETTEVLAASPISVSLENGEILGINPVVSSNKRRSINQFIYTPLYKKSKIDEVYN